MFDPMNWLFSILMWMGKSIVAALGWSGIVIAVLGTLAALALVANGVKFLSRPKGLFVATGALVAACLVMRMFQGHSGADAGQDAGASSSPSGSSSRPGASLAASLEPTPDNPIEASLVESTAEADAALLATKGRRPLDQFIPPLPLIVDSTSPPVPFAPVVDIPRVPVTVIPPGPAKPATNSEHKAKPKAEHAAKTKTFEAKPLASKAAPTPGLSPANGGRGVATSPSASATKATQKPSGISTAVAARAAAAAQQHRMAQMRAYQNAFGTGGMRGSMGAMGAMGGMGGGFHPMGGIHPMGGMGHVNGGMGHPGAVHHHR